MLGDELKKDIADPTSPFQNFLKYSPDALNYFFDQCIVKPCDIQVQGESFFDFFLFETDPWQESEMDIFATIIGKGKERILLHPLFDAFLKLKWKKNCGLFYLYVAWILLFQVVLVSYSLEKFSFLNGHLDQYCFWIFMIICFGVLCIQSFVGFFVYLLMIIRYLKFADKYCFFFLGKNVFQCFCWNLSHPVLFASFIFGQFDEQFSRSLCAILIFMSGIQTIQTLGKIPQIGIH